VGEPFGHSNKFIADAIYKQLTTLEHVLLAVLHMNLRLLEKLIEILPNNQQNFFRQWINCC
jgi:adenosylmethionine-8-amino-7-oxononanoate aminotransferase